MGKGMSHEGESFFSFWICFLKRLDWIESINPC